MATSERPLSSRPVTSTLWAASIRPRFLASLPDSLQMLRSVVAHILSALRIAFSVAAASRLASSLASRARFASARAMAAAVSSVRSSERDDSSSRSDVTPVTDDCAVERSESLIGLPETTPAETTATVARTAMGAVTSTALGSLRALVTHLWLFATAFILCELTTRGSVDSPRGFGTRFYSNTPRRRAANPAQRGFGHPPVVSEASSRMAHPAPSVSSSQPSGSATRLRGDP